MRSLFSLDEQPTIHWKERAHYKGCNNLWTHCNMSVKFFSLLPTTVMFIERLLLSLVKLTVHIPCSIFYFSLSLSNTPSLSLSPFHFFHFLFYKFSQSFSEVINCFPPHLVYFLLPSLFLHTLSLKLLLVCFYLYLFYSIFLFTLSFSLDINSLFLSIFVSFAHNCKLLKKQNINPQKIKSCS